MTFFSFFAAQHSGLGQRSLEDICDIMGLQIVALGHKAVRDPRNEKWETAAFLHGRDGVNIIVEGFTPTWVEVMARARAWGARFIILATEEPTYTGEPGDKSAWIGFNQGTQKEMTQRMFLFPEAAKHCDGILHLVPGEHVTRWYGQFAPAAQAELGYAPALMRPRFDPPPQWEFGFYGSLTPRRHKIVKKLAKLVGVPKGVRLMVDFKTKDERDAAMRQAKVIVQIRKFDKMGLVSSSRCNTALMIGRPVVAEPHELVKPWDEVIRFPETMEQFFTNALLARAAWRQVWEGQVARFKDRLTPEFCIGEPLRRIGVLGGEGGRAAA